MKWGVLLLIRSGPLHALVSGFRRLIEFSAWIRWLARSANSEQFESCATPGRVLVKFLETRWPRRTWNRAAPRAPPARVSAGQTADQRWCREGMVASGALHPIGDRAS